MVSRGFWESGHMDSETRFRALLPLGTLIISRRALRNDDKIDIQFIFITFCARDEDSGGFTTSTPLALCFY
jgi:hypothetical protein